MCLLHGILLAIRLILLTILICPISDAMHAKKGITLSSDRQLCVPKDDVIRAKRKSCLLRPDTGPCRADILVWYFDAKQHKCFRFFWGGCQGNGNNFATRRECMQYCFLKDGAETLGQPYFCSLAFDFGTCFGHYNRWGWDKTSGHCKRRLYSGCGGNQNNFETKDECMATCLMKPNNTLQSGHRLTTCIPLHVPELN